MVTLDLQAGLMYVVFRCLWCQGTGSVGAYDKPEPPMLKHNMC